MARGTRDDPFSAAESAAWWAANRERWTKWSFAKEPPKDGDWSWHEWHGWCRKNPSLAKWKKAK